MTSANHSKHPVINWDWDLEHADRKREVKADSAVHGVQPFLVDRNILRDVIREKLDCRVGRITFLNSGTFHKAYSVTMSDGRVVIARVARRFMPRRKTESEVATMEYIRAYTSIPVPAVYFYDSNPYNRLGGEYIIMSKAEGIPLSTIYQSMPHKSLLALLDNLASIIIPLFAHRFSNIGSLYNSPLFSPTQPITAWSSSMPTPTPASVSFPTPNPTKLLPNGFNLHPPPHKASGEFHVGPIVSWPFFGSNRGDLIHPTEIDLGPWPTARAYLQACVEREIQGVIRENEGKAAPHRLHLDPDEIQSSRHHHLQAVPGDCSDDSDEWDIEESEEEWDGPGDLMYSDYRRHQRSTFLVAHLDQREQSVRDEMNRWKRMMEKLIGLIENPSGKPEQFGLDPHDLSLENIFVDSKDHSKITCVIDWESTTIRPLWQCAHLPAFLQASPFLARHFRNAVMRIAECVSQAPQHIKSPATDLSTLAAEWLHYEAVGAHLRHAHRFAEWDGWEEGLVESILGPEDQEEDWIRDARTANLTTAQGKGSGDDEGGACPSADDVLKPLGMRRKLHTVSRVTAEEKERERALATTGDECGGRGGELGRRLEALLCIEEDGEGSALRARTPSWDSGHESEYEAEAE
ncbi:hypothetical protein B0F90DRAFT_1702927 [Multifurca ochricompacta]|uniref:Aminoglycoside phosphotransferase domain-containing protein n=1 Tax=Multifurca ochricompacta TaxID=376703 RepID=A0AAD4QP50_9AGAM|nr:hypothetical protein B0F90DRAFT_1702927 [Multifurca ochricompacta]